MLRSVIFWSAVMASTAGALFALDRHLDSDWRVPERWNPWLPLDIAAEPGLLTGFKLARAARGRDTCTAALATSGWRFEPLPDTQPAPGCGFDDAVRVTPASAATGRPLAGPIALSCRAALPLALWLRHGVEPAVHERFGQPLARIEHFGSYACRDVAGRPGRRSRHATADAIDIAVFVLRDGMRISIARDWSVTNDPADRNAPANRTAKATAHATTNAVTFPGAARALLLREARDSACRFFDAVLSPDYNRAHADHLHLEVGGFGGCR